METIVRKYVSNDAATGVGDNRTTKTLGYFSLPFFVFSFFAPNLAYASYQKIAPGDTVTLGEFVFDDDFVATTTPCTIGITDPLDVIVVPSTTPMTASTTGWHYYNYTTAANAASGTWPSVMKCGSAAAGDLVIVDKSFVVDWSVVSTSTIKTVVDESLTVATSSLAAVINANTNATVSTASSSLAAVINANTNAAILTASSSLFSTLPATIWSFSGRTLTSFGTLVADIASAVWTTTIRTLTGAGLDSGSLATLSDVQTATSSLASAITAGTSAVNSQILSASTTLTAEITKGSTVTLSDFGQTTVNSAYKAKLQVLNYASIPTDADSLPTVVIKDPVGTIQVPSGVMTKDSNGTYSYSYSIGSSALGGVWETVVSTVIGGQTVRNVDYWSLSSSPADVKITGMTDTVIPTITASVRIDNKGTAGSDFYYVYCIVSSADTLCGGNNNVASGSATAYINAGDYINLSLTLDGVPAAGTYWFKVKARALAESNWAASTEQFVAESGTVTPPPPPPPPGGGGGTPAAAVAIIPTITATSCDGADFNGDSKVNSVDFSILLAFWQKQPPFKNPCVDINKDSRVDSIDFSILLYQWKK